MLKTILPAAIFALFIASLLFEPLSHIDMKSLLLVVGGAVIFALTGKESYSTYQPFWRWCRNHRLDWLYCRFN